MLSNQHAEQCHQSVCVSVCVQCAEAGSVCSRPSIARVSLVRLASKGWLASVALPVSSTTVTTTGLPNHRCVAFSASQ